MSSKPAPLRALRIAVIAIIIIAPLSVFVSIPWLKEQPDGVVYLFAGIASTLTVLGALLLSVLQDRKLDEWHRTASQFSTQWGYSAGSAFIALLLALPPFHAFILSTVAGVAGVSEPNFKLVLLAFVGGFMLTVLTQAVATTLISIAWVSWKSRAPRDPA